MTKVYYRFGLLTMAVIMLTACTKNDLEETTISNTPDVSETADTPNNDKTSATTERVVMMLPETTTIELTDEQKSLIQNNNDFSFNLFRTIEQLAEKKQSNALSPISVTYVMGMLNDGAGGRTAQEITSVLGFGNSDAITVNKLCKDMIEGLPLVDPTVSMTMANYIAARQDVVLEDQFKNDMATYYHAETA